MPNTHVFPTPRCPRYDSLDFWRGVACLLIVVAHSQAYKFATLPEGSSRSTASLVGQIGRPGVLLNKVLDHCDIGVPIFFVISGYCIAASCDSSRRKSQTFREFYARRIRRIFPPYWFYLGILTLIFAVLLLLGVSYRVMEVKGVWLKPPWEKDFWSLVGTVFLTSTWQDRLVGSAGMVSGQAWSLCYEEQFYLVAGLLLWCSPRYFYPGIAAISAAVLGVFLASKSLPLDMHGFFFDGLWFLFAAGCLVFYRLNYCSGRSKYLADAFLIAAFFFIIYISKYQPSRWYDAFLFPAGGVFALLLCWLHPWDSLISSAALTRPISYCGRMCYSIYLIHYPISGFVSRQTYLAGLRGFWPIMLVTIPLILAISIGTSHLFAVLVERRFMPPSALPRKPARVAVVLECQAS